MKYYYYYLLLKIRLKKGMRTMKNFVKYFVIGFVIGLTAYCWASTTARNSHDMAVEYYHEGN